MTGLSLQVFRGGCDQASEVLTFLHALLFDLNSFQENLVHLKSLYKVYVYVQTQLDTEIAD